MEHLVFKDRTGMEFEEEVIHPGTYNANPLSAAAGFTCLQKCENPGVQRHCDEMAARIRTGINTTLEQHGINGCAWGEASSFHIVVGEVVTNRTAGDLRVPEGISSATLKAAGKAGLSGPLSAAMLLEGVDLFNTGGLLSVRHTAEDADFTVGAFERAVLRMRLDGLLP